MLLKKEYVAFSEFFLFGCFVVVASTSVGIDGSSCTENIKMVANSKGTGGIRTRERDSERTTKC